MQNTFPDPQFTIRDLQRSLERRALLWLTDSLAVGNSAPFGGIGVHDTVLLSQVDNGEGGWSEHINGALASSPNPFAGTACKMNQSPRGVWRVTFAAAIAAITRQIVGFTNIINSSTPDGAYLRQLTTGNVFFVTRGGGFEQTTDLGALTGPFEWEIRTNDAGVTWLCYKDQVLVATHATTVPPASGTGFGGCAIHARSSGTTRLLLDYTMGEADRVRS